MALFGRDSDDATPSRPAPVAPRQPASKPARKTTLIASGATLIGEIGGDTDVMIEGTVEGKVHPSQDVIVGEQGRVKGEIAARRVRIAGKVHGNVRGMESVEILATGSLEGDVASPGMVIGDGAFFKGRVEMTGAAARGKQETPQKMPPQKTPEKTPEKTPSAAVSGGSPPDRAGSTRSG